MFWLFFTKYQEDLPEIFINTQMQLKIFNFKVTFNTCRYLYIQLSDQGRYKVNGACSRITLPIIVDVPIAIVPVCHRAQHLAVAVMK